MTKDELKDVIVGHEDTIKEQALTIEELRAVIKDITAKDNVTITESVVVELKKRMYYTGKIDLSTGMEPSAFGIKLTLDESGLYVGQVPESRCETELQRGFVFELTETEG